MVNTYNPIASTTVSAQTSTLKKNTSAESSGDILSSFKEMFALMTMSNSMPSSGQQTSLGMTDMMAPLMLILLEKLVELQIDNSDAASGTALGNILSNQGPKAEPTGMPLSGSTLTQDYHPGHNGLDFGVKVGTPIQTTMDGQVIYAGWNDQGYGNLVIVENGAYRTYYAHLSSIPVSVGETVTAGTTIGLSGNTGNSTGPHLHYEIRKNKVPIDPTSATLG